MNHRTLRLLLLESSKAEQERIRTMLRVDLDGFDVDLADTAAGAVDRLRSEGYDCVLMGAQFAKLNDVLRAAPERDHRTPVIALTSRDDGIDEVALVEQGAAGYLPKRNITPEGLERAIFAALRSTREQEARVAQRALTESRQFFAAMLHSIADAVIAVDHTGLITFMNPAAERLCETTNAEAENQPLWDVLRADRPDRSPLKEQISNALLGDANYSSRSEIAMTASDGRRLIVEERVSLLRGGDRATPIGAILTLTDVTARRRAQERSEFLAATGPALASARTVEEILELAAAVCVPMLGPACVIVAAEDSGARRYLAAAPEGTTVPVPPSDSSSDAVVTALLGVRDAIALSEVVPSTLAPAHSRVVPFGGSRLRGALVLLTEEPLADDHAAFAKDFAHRVALAADNCWLVARLQDAVRVRDDFMAVVSHDLRSPLGTCALVAEGLRDELADAALADHYAGALERAVARMNRLIQDLLDAEAIDAGGMSIELTECDAPDLVSETVELFRALAEDKGLALEADIQGHLPRLLGDRHRVLQALANLVGNAIKFTNKGSVTLSARHDRAGVCFTVEDTGPGIRPDQLPRLFDRFWRGDRREPGAGLGLPIAKGILAAHGSRLSVESELGSGTRFRFVLPSA